MQRKLKIGREYFLRPITLFFLFLFLRTDIAYGPDLDKPPASLSPQAKKVWDLLASQTPSSSGGIEFLLRANVSGYLSKMDENAFDEVVETPLFKERIQIGRQYRKKYWNELERRFWKETFAEFGISRDPLNDIVQSFYSLNSSQANTTRKATEQEAERLAQSEMKARFLDYNQKPNDSFYQNEYLKTLSRYRESEVVTPSGSNSSAFENWKKIMMKQVEDLVLKNTLHVARYSAQHNFKKIGLIDVTKDNLPAKPLSTQDLNQLKVSDLKLRYLPPSINHKIPDDMWVAETKEGLSLGNLESPEHHKNEGKAWPYSCSNIYWEAPKPADQKILSPQDDLFWLLSTRLSIMNEYETKVLELLKEKNSPSVFLSALLKLREKYRKEFESFDHDWMTIDMNRPENPREIWTQVEYKWWGFSQRPDFWVLRDEEANKKGLQKFPFGASSLFSHNSHSLSSLSPSFNFSHQSKPSNTSWQNFKEAQEIPAFSLKEKNAKAKPPLFFAVPYKENIPDQGFKLLPSRSSDLILFSRPQTPFQGKVLFVPTPDGMLPSQVKLTGPSGKELHYPKDFVLLSDPSQQLFVIQLLQPTKEELSFEVEYQLHNREGALPKSIGRLENFSRLRELTASLHEAGFKDLSTRLTEIVSRAQSGGFTISLSELTDAFKNSARYSFVKKAEPKLLHPNNPFSPFSHFLNEEGVLCAQCDTSNALFAEFLKLLYKNQPGVSVSSEVGYLWQSGNEVTMAGRHQRTVIKFDGKKYTLDVTPVLGDPRNPSEAFYQLPHDLNEPGQDDQLKYEELLRLMKEHIAKLSKIPEIQRRIRNPGDLGELKEALRLSKIATGLTSHDFDLAMAKSQLKEMYPSIRHDYQTLEEAKAFVQKRIIELSNRLDLALNLRLQGKLPLTHKVYTDPNVLNPLQDVLHSASELTKIYLCPEVFRKIQSK